MKNVIKIFFFQFSKSIFSLEIEKISLFSFDSETIVGGLQFGRKRYFWRICTVVLKISKKWFSFPLKNTKKSFMSVDIDFFQIFSFDLNFYLIYFEFLFDLSRYIFPGKLACNCLFFTKIDFLSMVFIYGPKSHLAIGLSGPKKFWFFVFILVLYKK